MARLGGALAAADVGVGISPRAARGGGGRELRAVIRSRTNRSGRERPDVTDSVDLEQLGLTHPRLRGLAFDQPFTADGVTVIPASTTRGHVARRRSVDDHRGEFDAEMRGGRPVGAFVIKEGVVRWRPALDVSRLLVTAEAVVGAVLVAERLARRSAGAKAAVTMGPGGWVSMKGGAMALRPAGRLWRRLPTSKPTEPRPLWAKLLSAKSLQSLLRY